MIRRIARDEAKDGAAARAAFQAGLELTGQVTGVQMHYLAGYRQAQVMLTWEWRSGAGEPATMRYLLALDADWTGHLKRVAGKLAESRRAVYSDRAVG